MLRVAIVGATGYTGAELLRLLGRHPKVLLTTVTSERSAGRPLGEVFPHLHPVPDLLCEALNLDSLLDRADFFFIALPHSTGMTLVEALVRNGKKVVDLSADFRLRDASIYEQLYETPHACPDLLQEAVYGLPEKHRQAIQQASLIANPGCYPTGALLALIPLLRDGLIEGSSIIIDAKSGVSGAGRSPHLSTHYSEVNESISAYKVLTHRHEPEIYQESTGIAGQEVQITFVPHLVSTTRGILTTLYAKTSAGIGHGELLEAYQSYFKGAPFIRILNDGCWPNTAHVEGSNVCQLGFAVNDKLHQLVCVTAIDNLMKGASGQAVQNMNLMMGFEETMGLESSALFP